MQINPAKLANPGKSSAAQASQSTHGTSGNNGMRAGGNDHSEGNDSLPAFSALLGGALQGKQAGKADLAAERNEQAATPATPATLATSATDAPSAQAASAAPATPAVPAHVAQQGDDDEAPAAEGQLDGGLQAFVNSLQTPVTALAMPATPAATATDPAATDPDAQAVDALARDAEGHGKGQAHAFGLDDARGTRTRTRPADELGKVAPADAAGKAGAGNVDGKENQASLRAREVAASKVAPEFRAALNDAQATRPGLQDTLAAENGSALPQAIAAAAAAGTPATTGANADTPQTAHVAPHLYSPQWQDAFGQQVVWMTKNEQQIASLTMNPPELGPVRVTLSVSDGQASAAFVSLQPEVRQAIQDAVPRLKEMLADAGLQLQQASVDSGDAGREAASRAQGEDGTRRSRSAGSANDGDDAAMTADAASLRTTRSMAASRLVDLFA